MAELIAWRVSLLLFLLQFATRRSASSVSPRWLSELPRAWQYGETQEAAIAGVARCMHPEQSDNELFNGHWIDELDAAVSSTRNHRYSSQPQTSKRPLKTLVDTFGETVGTIAPWHRAAVITSGLDDVIYGSQDMDYPNSRCFTHNYSSDAVDDEHGCNLFKKSFSRLQGLQTCIVDALRADSSWLAYRRVAKGILAGRPIGSRAGVDNPRTISEEDLIPTSVHDISRKLGNCVADGTCVIFDAIRRADEIVKNVAYKDWTGGSREILDLHQEVARKIQETVTVPGTWRRPRRLPSIFGGKKRYALDTLPLLDRTVETIRDKCFFLDYPVPKHITEPLPEPVRVLKRSLPCWNMMYDQVEVAGFPEKPVSNAITMWSPELRPSHRGREQNLGGSPVLCGRAAIGMVAYHTAYRTQTYALTPLCVIDPVDVISWKGCMTADYYNCVCMEKCFVRALVDRMCELVDSCCTKFKYSEYV
eukprot:TRINITY_DN71598_c0_g1_i1.p1 TRINITY_DN71598_c0_g1~~TRINITY_DN71598_c0_g1_i1.p1  ORF type:complete len:476 (-),score=38.25 TRINITY_DN71598_c0_g1_i1:130-1557(-)